MGPRSLRHPVPPQLKAWSDCRQAKRYHIHGVSRVCIICMRPEGLILSNARLTQQVVVLQSLTIGPDMTDNVLSVDVTQTHITTEMWYLGEFEGRVTYVPGSGLLTDKKSDGRRRRIAALRVTTTTGLPEKLETFTLKDAPKSRDELQDRRLLVFRCPRCQPFALSTIMLWPSPTEPPCYIHEQDRTEKKHRVRAEGLNENSV